MKTIKEVRTALLARRDRSAWDRGVTAYALDLLDGVEECHQYNNTGASLDPAKIKAEALNGADSWSQYSYGGGALIYDGDIAERLCSPSELRKTKGGDRNPNSRETWLDCQTRALIQACRRLIDTARE